MTRRRWTLGLVAGAALAALVACRAEEGSAREGKAAVPEAQAAAPAAAPAQVEPAGAKTGRRIPIKVDNKGYHPPSAPASAGEKLLLSFTLAEDSECARQVIVDGKTTDLVLNKAVDIPTTMPANGDLIFTCGMKMFEGRVVVAKK
jgi:Cupredoxin-like domain